jgi:putative ABC transport system ATP-binding protein
MTDAQPPPGAAKRRTSMVIMLRQITKTYVMGDVEVHALRGVSLDVRRGEMMAIMGQSGSGKSTLMHILGCLDVPTSGRYWLDGVDVRALEESTLSRVRNRKIGFVFQSFNLIARTSALANVELPLAYAGVGRKERRRRAIEALESVGLGSRLDHMPNEMSGGQQQRAAVARAIATNPSMILADEPTGNLDTEATAEVMGIFARLNAEGRTVVLITHEPEVAEYCRRVVTLLDGDVVHDSLYEGRAAPHGGPIHQAAIHQAAIHHAAAHQTGVARLGPTPDSPRAECEGERT